MAFAHSWLGIAFGVAFTVLLVVAAASDIRYRRIPNALVLTIFALGAAYTIVTLGFRALAFRFLGGAATGLVVWLPFWALGFMGAGDVKIFAAAAAWLGPTVALGATLLSALAGGVLGIVWIVFARRGRDAGQLMDAVHGSVHGTDAPAVALEAKRPRVTVPYGVAMAVGLMVAAWIPVFGH